MKKALSLIFAASLMSFTTIDYAANTYGSKLCKSDTGYTCYKVKRGETWDSLFKDKDQQTVIMKLNRTNNRLHPGQLLALPQKSVVALMDIAPFDKQIQATGDKVIYVSLSNLAWGAYDKKGTLVNWGPVSGGKGYCPDIGRGCHTKTGNFEIYAKQGAGCVSTKFPIGRGGAPMPYCMFFHGGFALHGSHDIPGYNASHGCVRMFVSDAKWLNQEFVRSESVPVIINK